MELLNTEGKYTIARVEFGDGNYLVFKAISFEYANYFKERKINQTIPFVVTEHYSNLVIVPGAIAILILGQSLIPSSFEPPKSHESTKYYESQATISNKIEISEENKLRLCKSYIGSLFGRTTRIMSGNSFGNGYFEVQYTRQYDSTTWKYKCTIKNGSITWAAWLKHERRWGRWRNEDRVNYTYEHENKRIKYEHPVLRKVVYSYL